MLFEFSDEITEHKHGWYSFANTATDVQYSSGAKFFRFKYNAYIFFRPTLYSWLDLSIPFLYWLLTGNKFLVLAFTAEKRTSLLLVFTN